MTHEKVKIGIALGVGLGIGGGVGYYVAVRKVRAQATEEVAKVQDLYKRLREEDAAQAREDWSAQPDHETEDSDDDPQEGVEELEETVRDLGYIGSDDYTPAKRDRIIITQPEPQYPGDEGFPEDIDPDLVKEAEYVRNIRIHNPNSDADPNDVTKWERDPNRPYVITDSEFRNDMTGKHEKISLMYFSGDDTLCEQDGTYIPDQDGTAGDENLHNYFGLASGDPNILHVRNERVMCDFEITLDNGSYQREVLGMEVENQMLQQSKNVIRKMRNSDG